MSGWRTNLRWLTSYKAIIVIIRGSGSMTEVICASYGYRNTLRCPPIALPRTPHAEDVLSSDPTRHP